jgi:hypothetical protein
VHRVREDFVMEFVGGGGDVLGGPESDISK